jgi:hypothetical protein
MALQITSANAVFLLGIAGVYPIPQQIQGFGVDEAIDFEAAETAVVQQGVDGQTVSGWVPRITRMTVTLLAASSSFPIFENWIAAQDQNQQIYYATGLIMLPALQRKYSLPQGTLTRFPALPNARRVLMQRQFTIEWAWPITSGPM